MPHPMPVGAHEPGLEAFVAVDRRCPQQAELLGGGDETGDVLLEDVAHPVRAVVILEHRLLAIWVTTDWSARGTTSPCH